MSHLKWGNFQYLSMMFFSQTVPSHRSSKQVQMFFSNRYCGGIVFVYILTFVFFVATWRKLSSPSDLFSCVYFAIFMSAKKTTLACCNSWNVFQRNAFQVACFLRRAHSMVSNTEMLKSYRSSLGKRSKNVYPP